MRSLLTGLLAAQMVLAASLFIYNQNQGKNAAATPLLDFPTADIDRIILSDNEDTTTFTRDGDNWLLADLAGLPANASRINTLFSTLDGLKTQWPVVSSASGRERFEVSEDKFQRHLQLYQGDTLLGDYYFGTSPGFRQTHTRRADDDEVYALTFNNVDLPVDDNEWLKKDLLAVTGVSAIKGADFELMKEADSWQLAPSADTAETSLDAEKAQALATALQNLRVLGVVDSVDGAETRTLTITTPDGIREYQFTKVDSQHVVKRNDREQSFTISASDYAKLAEVVRADLLQQAPAAAEADMPPAAAIEAGSASEHTAVANPTH